MRAYLRHHLPSLVFGSFDGLTVTLGAVLALTGHPQLVLPTAGAVAAAEAVGMAAGEWLSDSDNGFGASLAIGASTGIAALLPALPYGLLRPTAALCASITVFVLLALGIALARGTTRGRRRALGETFGVLGAVVAVVFLTQLLSPGGAR